MTCSFFPILAFPFQYIHPALNEKKQYICLVFILVSMKNESFLLYGSWRKYMVWMFKNERMSWKKNNVLVVNNKNTNCSYYYQKAKQVLNILLIEMRIYIWYYNRNLNIKDMQNWNWYNNNSKQKIMSSKSIWMKLGKNYHPVIFSSEGGHYFVTSMSQF